MTSIVGIYSMALANIGQSGTVSSLDERSKEQRTCTLFYQHCLEQMLSDFDWPFATKQVYLADLGSPVGPWAYRYAYPADCLKVRGLVEPGSGLVVRADQRIPYQTGYGDAGQVIHTNQAQAAMVYTVRITDAERLNAMAVEALSLLLASKIAMPMAANASMVEQNMQLYREAAQRAQVHAFEQTQEQPEPISEFLEARN